MSSTDKHRDVYREEAKELLAELETALLELEADPGEQDLLFRVFRALHTIKGSGSMFGYDAIARFTHELETAFDLVRSGQAPMTRDLVSIGLKARDLIAAMLAAADGGAGSEHQAEAAAVLGRLRELMPGLAQRTAKNKKAAPTASSAKGDKEQITYRVQIVPHPDFFRTGVNPANILEDLTALGESTVVANTDGVPGLAEMDAESCYTSWDVVLTTDRGRNAIEDIFIFVHNDAAVRIEVIGSPEEAADKKFGEILVERGAASPEAVQKALAQQQRLGDILTAAGAVDPNKVEVALAEQQHLKNARDRKQKEEAVMSVRVPAEKLDLLVDLVGELVTMQARLSQTVVQQRIVPLMTIAEEVERLTTELRDNAMSVRMMPIGSTFSKFRRLVRDLSRDLDKDLDLTTDGAETELDKTVIERLSDPLVHLIRNSIDHGIERPDERTAAGKPAKGTVRLAAEHSGANVLIRISDDGKGLNVDAIRAKAVEQGLIPADAQLSPKELYPLIFAPGFSTAKAVTSVSGRGVGMDVVKKAIDALRGSVEIESEPGAGTTITLKLPLTLAIIDGFLTKIGGQFFVFPLAIVEECVELIRDAQQEQNGKRLARVRGEIVPYVRLRDRFAMTDGRPNIEQIVITRTQNGRVGFAVDEVVGGHQTVIKNLGRLYRDAEGLSGATILGDGTVALILDVPRLVQMVEREDALVQPSLS